MEVVEQIESYRKLGVSYILSKIRDLVKLKFAPLELLAKIAGSLRLTASALLVDGVSQNGGHFSKGISQHPTLLCLF